MERYPATASGFRRSAKQLGLSHREPCALLHEIAERLGVTTQRLAHAMRRAPEHAPRPVLVHDNNCAAFRRVYYRMSDFRRWIAHHNLELKQ